MLNALQKDELDEAKEFAQEKKPFQVTDSSSADWVLGKLAALKAEDKENDKTLKDNIAQAKAWRDRKSKETQDSRDYFESLLTSYFQAKQQDDPKFKIDTPNGVVKAKKVPAKWIYDDKLLIKSLKEADATKYIRIKEEPDKKPLKTELSVTALGDVITEDGVKLDGVHVDPASYKIEIKPLEMEEK
ncbi:host-nuclease inhibitor Gam family protein [Lapidilactobacillus bayanensis]|uniref:host-nuclease inhibitor Gam family protein n=1 Tax=Lapidilactobacillus bayanensis TaxID=2485998 RepID=UPI000F7B5152|nr:host-nuclease inhibitor Gam family protein [Lapidilactobacillus bayanensis]